MVLQKKFYFVDISLYYIGRNVFIAFHYFCMTVMQIDLFNLGIVSSKFVDVFLGSADRVYAYLNCSSGPEGNKEQSYLTLLSNPGLMFGIINIVGKIIFS